MYQFSLNENFSKHYYAQSILTLEISDAQNFSTNDLHICTVLTPELESVAEGCEGLHAKQK